MTRRLALAWSFGATAGYLVGWLAGSNVLKLAEGHRLGRPGVAVRLPEPRTAREGIPGHPDPRSALRSEIPAQRDGLAEWEREIAKPASGRCTRRSPGGGLTCIVHGPHAEHWYEAVYAPDRKDDADERIE